MPRESSPLETEICGVLFKNPVIGASGTAGYGLEYIPLLDLNRIGGISVKGISLEETAGNPMPRVRETASGMLNAIGLQNIGVTAFIKDKLPYLRKYNIRIIVNFWGKSADEYVKVASILDNADIDMLEMNISCPNVKEGGISFSSDPEKTREVVGAVRKAVRNKPLIVKLSPNVTDIKIYARVCEAEGADALSAINTVTGMAINVHTHKPWLANVTGGLSGPAIKPVAVKSVFDIYRSVKIPVIGIGGIMNYEDVLEFYLAGASAVQVGTANFRDSETMITIIGGLEKYCSDNNIAALSELTGTVLL
ncbi:MAG: dihydroorotate dehydrogenase [Deferribacteraceae bacterium]|nr:dihydroorotate dehydrogenase [Deferribacteraceae bacterium]